MLSLIPWQLKAGAIALAVAVTFGAGWKTRDAFCDAAAARAEVASLRKQVEARDQAALQDQAKAALDALVREQLERTIDDLESKISVGECLGADDANRLRDLWK